MYLCKFIWEEQNLVGQWTQANNPSLEITFKKFHCHRYLRPIVPLYDANCSEQVWKQPTRWVYYEASPDFTVKALIFGHCCWKLQKARINKRASADKEGVVRHELEKMRRWGEVILLLRRNTELGRPSRKGGKSTLKIWPNSSPRKSGKLNYK